MRLEDLADVHARWHAERVEDDIHRRPVGEERHVLVRQDAADDALVAVAPGHLVAGLQLALHRDEHLDHLEHARRQLVAALQLLDTVVEPRLDDAGGLVILALDRLEIGLARIVGDGELPPFALLDALQHLVVDRRTLLGALRRRGRGLPDQHLAKTRIGRAVQDRALVLGILAKPVDLLALDRHRALVLVDAVAIEHAHVHDRCPRRPAEGAARCRARQTPSRRRWRGAIFPPASSGSRPSA